MRPTNRVTAAVLCAALLLSPALARTGPAKVKEVKIRGYITEVTSPTSFEIDDYRITRDESVVLEFENQSKDVLFRPEDVRVGAEVEIQGTLNEETNELKAKKIKIDLEQFRKFKLTSVISSPPAGIEQTEQGWRGTFFADGHRVRVEPTTQVLFKANNAEQKAARERDKKQKASAEQPADDDDEAGAQPLKSLADVTPGTVMTYEGVEQPDGSVAAERVVFMRNELEKGEAALWKSLKLKEKAPNFSDSQPGELKIDNVGKFKTVPCQEAQDYVARIGQSLVPAYQKALPEGDPQKIAFKFYVINDKTANAFALPNGIVVVHSGMFDVLENEAQLADVLAHEIAHATQEHTWRQLNKDKKKRTALAVGGIAAAAFGIYGLSNVLTLVQAAMINGYQRTLENQADRVGLEYAVAAGYDPREAPRVWKLMAKKHGDQPTNFFWSSHDNNTTRRSFLMREIRNNYSQLDLGKLKKGSEEDFQRIAQLVRDAAAKKKKIKVTG
jgi:hypothetical protein